MHHFLCDGADERAREYRRLLSEGARAPGAGPELLRQAAGLCEGGEVAAWRP